MLLIRPYEARDLAGFSALMTDSRVMMPPLSLQQASALFNRLLGGDERFVGAWAVIEEEYVGHVALYIAPGGRTPELSFFVDPAHWGKGIATEAASSVLENAPFDVVRATVLPSQAAAIRVLEKIGMTLAREAEGHRIYQFTRS